MKSYEEMAQNALSRGKAIRKQKVRRNRIFMAAASLVLIAAICIGTLTGGAGDPDVTGDPQSNLMAAPNYPKMAPMPDWGDYLNDWEGYTAARKLWSSSQSQQYTQPDGYADSLTDFFYASMAEFLQGKGNPTCSPLNVYLALAMLAETTNGNSRQQILDLFGLETIEQLRQQASYVWNAHYSADGQTTVLLANSLWLDDAYTFHNSTAQLLANHYYASSYSGNLGTENMNTQLQAWLNQNTGNLLKEEVKKVELDPGTVFALASTVSFSANWDSEEFEKKDTKNGIFHGLNGDRRMPFMNEITSHSTYYWSDNFGAVYLRLSGGNTMWLILPDEGYTAADVLASEDYLRMTMDPKGWRNKKVYNSIRLSLPKFDVSCQQDLIAGMRNLGITDVFDSSCSDFTPLTDTSGLYINQINHAARVTVDEQGCTAAAFMLMGTLGMPPAVSELDFVLDRPFMFVISSRDNLPLLAGIVNDQ